jgi:hypothetical protein
MIYNKDFIPFIEETLGGPIKVTSKNIICKCPWCEYDQEKSHYHLYISLEAPIFHCFHANCEKGGNIRKFIKKLKGHDVSDKYVDKEKIKKFEKISLKSKEVKDINITLPKLNENKFSYKSLYLKRRLGFPQIELETIKGLIFDVNEFLEINNIPITPTIFRLKDFLHSNFIGFLTEHSSMVVFRNMDPKSSFKFFKLPIEYTPFLDYYKLRGNNPNSNKIVLGEGIFDIFSEQLYDVLNIRESVNFYASVLSSKFLALIKSIVFHEQLFKPEVVILSDRGVELEYYKKMKFYNKHIIDKMTVYYNSIGKDFNEYPVNPIECIL